MPIIRTNPLLGNADYTANRYPIIKAFESAVPSVYQDGATANGGYATIGVGFLVSANVSEILAGIDPDLATTLGLSDTGYLNLVNAIGNATNNVLFKTNDAAQTAIQNAINGVLGNAANYANNQTPSPAPSFTLRYSMDATTADTQMHTTFDLIIDKAGGYEDVVDEWLNGDPENTVEALPDSRERMVFLSLAYNNLIGFTKNERGREK